VHGVSISRVLVLDGCIVGQTTRVQDASWPLWPGCGCHHADTAALCVQATQENLSPVERMRVMFPRLVAGTYNPLPPTVRLSTLPQMSSLPCAVLDTSACSCRARIFRPPFASFVACAGGSAICRGACLEQDMEGAAEHS